MVRNVQSLDYNLFFYICKMLCSSVRCSASQGVLTLGTVNVYQTQEQLSFLPPLLACAHTTLTILVPECAYVITVERFVWRKSALG